jgi:Polysaccharide deacetylase
MQRERLVLSIDLEWFYNGDETGNLSGFSALSLEERRSHCGDQIKRSVDRVLRTLEEHDQRITFFTIAELDEAYPEIVASIAERGHEIAVHSYRHDDLSKSEDLDAELRRCAPMQQKYGAVSFRAPFISVAENIYRHLKRYGYRYDSSLYGTTTFAHEGIEIYPVSVLPYVKQTINRIPSRFDMQLMKRAVPFGSGLFVGLFHQFCPGLIRRFAQQYRQPPCLFIHSWQIEQPEYSLQAKLKNPWMLAYSIELSGAFESLCRCYELMRLKDCYE